MESGELVNLMSNDQLLMVDEDEDDSDPRQGIQPFSVTLSAARPYSYPWE